MRGDVDSSGTVDILDVVKIVGGILGTVELSDNERFISDIDGDGAVNVLDIVMAVNSILGN